MRRRDFLVLAAATAAWLKPVLVWAQQPRSVPRLAVLSTALTATVRQDLFQGLTDYGYADGKNITVEFFTASTTTDMRATAAKAVGSRPDVIFTYGLPAAFAAKDATSTIPIVFSGAGYALALGLVPSLARPGGNLTGMTSEGYEEDAKKVAILKEIVPSLSRMAVIGLPAAPDYAFNLERVKDAAKAVAIDTLVLEAKEGAELEPLFLAAREGGAQAMYIIANSTYLNPMRRHLADLALKYRFPAIANQNYARDGLLIGYNINGYAMDLSISGQRRAGYFIDLILRGTKPGDIPVEQPTNLDMVVNLKTARALGVTIPFAVIAEANEVIE
jgi:putative ABC transport system substrate-binding protein